MIVTYVVSNISVIRHLGNIVWINDDVFTWTNVDHDCRNWNSQGHMHFHCLADM